jgi:hypothetical protein
MRKVFLFAMSVIVAGITWTAIPKHADAQGRLYACFKNNTNRWVYYRIEWRDGSGRYKIYRVRPYQRPRIYIGRRAAVWCYSYRSRLVTRLSCQRPKRVIRNC